MKPYSKDLRLRVLSAVDAGTPREEVAETFSVSMPTIKRWLEGVMNFSPNTIASAHGYSKTIPQ
jgi:transposase